MESPPRYEMASMVSHELPLEAPDLEPGVVSPFHEEQTSKAVDYSSLEQNDMSNINESIDKPRPKPSAAAGTALDSMDFEEIESRQWRKVSFVNSALTDMNSLSIFFIASTKAFLSK